MTDARTPILTDRILQGLIAILAIVFVVLAGPFIASSVLEQIYSATRESELQYSLTITTSSALSDVTLFIPLPTDGKGMSPVIQLLGTGNQSTTFGRFDASIYGANNESYLRLSTDLLYGPLNATELTYFFTITADSSALHTRLPLRYDYTLLPKQSLIEVSCGTVPCVGQPLCFQYQSLIYASYNTSPDARVEIRADLSGSNQWKIVRESRNGYTDSLVVQLHGPASGWYTADGYLVTSCGDDNPFWIERVDEIIRARIIAGAGVDTSMMRWHTFTPLP
jgi:hypothetical protein